MDKPEIGIIGGSGVYSLLKNPTLFNEPNDYGAPSAAVALGRIGNKGVAFIPRHGIKHTIPPHKVPYRANIQAFADLGVKRIVSTNAMGSLTKDYRPGDFVFLDQFVNMTYGRDGTFFDKDMVAHISTAEPYCPELRSIAIKTARSMKLRFHETGTIVVINGPRFSTKAESRFFSRQGFQVINMTQYPEVPLARERQMCYLGVGVVTDYDVGLEGTKGIKPVNAEEVSKVFGMSVEKVKQLIERMIPGVPTKRGCDCGSVLDNAFATQK